MVRHATTHHIKSAACDITMKQFYLYDPCTGDFMMKFLPVNKWSYRVAAITVKTIAPIVMFSQMYVLVKLQRNCLILLGGGAVHLQVKYVTSSTSINNFPVIKFRPVVTASCPLRLKTTSPSPSTHKFTNCFCQAENIYFYFSYLAHSL